MHIRILLLAVVNTHIDIPGSYPEYLVNVTIKVNEQVVASMLYTEYTLLVIHTYCSCCSVPLRMPMLNQLLL